MKRLTTIGLILSALLVLASLFRPITVYSQFDLAKVELGLPLPFIIQKQSYHPSFPWQTSFSSVWEHPTQILWPIFFLDVAIIFGLIILVWKTFKAISLRIGRH